MPPKTTHKPSTKKAEDAKPSKAAPVLKSTKTAPAEKKTGAPEDAPAAPKVVKETVSLIDAKPKTRRPRPTELENRPFAHIPISRILEPEAPKAPTPAPAPEPVVVTTSETPGTPPPPAPPTLGSAGEGSGSGDEKIIHLKPPFSVKDLATAMGIKPFQVISDLMEMNIFASINQTIEADIAAKVCTKHGLTFEKEKRKEGGGVHKVEDKPKPPPEPVKPKAEELQLRAPIVTFMGHVDHGKTTLMDVIRKTRVAAGEAGGITQHIGAYSVKHGDHRITFLDTPGHAAFTAMRARGANATDIVVLVIAADDGIMPQTMEALNHAKAAKVLIIVAITKIDAAGANVDKVKGQLQEKGLVPEDWGGEVGVCPVSALKGQGVSDLLDRILLESEVLELKASSQQTPRGTVIEAQIEQGRGPTATVLVRMGTLKIGDPFICGPWDGKVKSLIDDTGKPLKSAGPSTPVKVLGFAGLPNAGDELVVMETEREAKALSAERQADQRMNKLAAPQRATLENLFASLAEGQRKKLNVVLKADVQGSLEALVTSLKEINSKKIDLDIVHSAVGPISESDILLATASNAVVVGFNVKVESSAANTAKRENVQIKLFSIIYELIDQVKEAMAGMLDPETRESVIGHAVVKKVFELSRGLVAGCEVKDGRIARTARARVLRDRTPIYDGGLATLRRFQDDVKEVRSGLECGIKLGDFNDYEVGDIIQCYILEKLPQKL